MTHSTHTTVVLVASGLIIWATSIMAILPY